MARSSTGAPSTGSSPSGCRSPTRSTSRRSRRGAIEPSAGGHSRGEVIEVYPGATLRTMGVASYKSRPDEAVHLGIAACVAAGIKLEVDRRIVALCCRYSSGTGKTPDYDVADTFIALCTAILNAEGACRPVIASDPVWQERLPKEWKGAIWVPTVKTSTRRSAATRSEVTTTVDTLAQRKHPHTNTFAMARDGNRTRSQVTRHRRYARTGPAS